jgi:hypothetical protein
MALCCVHRAGRFTAISLKLSKANSGTSVTTSPSFWRVITLKLG